MRDPLRVSMAAMVPEEPARVSSGLHDLEVSGISILGYLQQGRPSRRAAAVRLQIGNVRKQVHWAIEVRDD